MYKILITALFLFVTSGFSAETENPVDLIRSKDRELQSLLRQKKETPERTDRIKALINGIFDFQELGRKSLGTEVSKTLTPDQQKRFVESFKAMVENTSLKKLEVYRSDSTRYEAPEVSEGEKLEIKAHTFLGGQESILVYKMHKVEGAWKAWDLVIDDLSTYRNYKEQFKRILETKDIEQLISLLNEKAETAKKEISGSPQPPQPK